MRYDIVFDATHGVYSFWWLPLIPLGMLLYLVVIRRHVRRSAAHYGIMVAFLLLVTGVVTEIVIANGWQLRDEMRTGAYSVVEGTVTDFVPGDPAGHGAEQFTVRNDSDAVSFEYDPDWVTPGYHRIEPLGGVVHAGLHVRVTYIEWPVDPAIARIEVARPMQNGTTTRK